MKRWVCWRVYGLASICLGVGLACAPLQAQDGETLYMTHCAICHETGGDSPAPGREQLRQMSPEQILAALDRGAMSRQGAERSRAEQQDSFLLHLLEHTH